MSGKQAVVLIHGIGEQRPMQNLRAFVDAVWTTDDGAHDGGEFTGGRVLWSKPDFVSDSFELRRLTTIKNCAGVRTDFYEFYWAHLMDGHRWRHVTAWARLLLFRWPWTVPPKLRGLWVILLLLCLIPPTAAAVGFLTVGDGRLESAIAAIGGAVAGLLATLGSSRFLIDRVGDAARYLNVAPPNIERRHNIRIAGLRLIRNLHNRRDGEGGPEYDRIIVAGHSLGSVIGYDILTHAWARTQREPKTQEQAVALDALDKLSVSEPGSDAYQEAQGRYLAEIQAQGIDWRVTDFVTLGSPLAYADLLLAENGKEFARRIMDRELPTCPPECENESLAYEKHGKRVPNHAAVFGPTRWTNLYFPSRFVVFGDIIAGPLQGVLGEGIRDVPLTIRRRWGLLAHTLYWRSGSFKTKTEPHITALRGALRLVESRADTRDTDS